MSLAHIAPRNRFALRLHGWLLMLWAAAVGAGTSWLMLYGLSVHSLALRYTVGAGSIYFLGFVWGGWWYAKWWNVQRGVDAELPQRADLADVLAYQQQQEAVGKKLSWFEWLGDFGVGLGDDPLSALLAVLWLIGFLVFAVVIAGYAPILVTDALAGFLAEIVLEFVIGGVLVRRVLRPQSLQAYWAVVLGKTWLAGFLLMVSGAVQGFAVQVWSPGAQTLFQALR